MPGVGFCGAPASSEAPAGGGAAAAAARTNGWRYQAEGVGALEDRSRAPHSHPSRIDRVGIEALVQARRSHSHWGARKILAWLARKHPEFDLPVASTVSEAFTRYGLSRAR
jgi:putative transposase